MDIEKKEELNNKEEVVQQTEERVEETQTPTTEEKETGVSEDSTEDYYKKELSKEEKRLAYLSRKQKESKDESDKKYIDEDILEQKMSSLRQELLQEKEMDFVKSVSSSEDQAKLIFHHLENTVKRTGDLVEDVKLARFLANRNKYEQLEKELPAIQNSQRFGRTVQGQPQENNQKNYSPQELALMAKFGIDPNTGKVSS
jgi:hypothetical protein